MVENKNQASGKASSSKPSPAHSSPEQRVVSGRSSIVPLIIRDSPRGSNTPVSGQIALVQISTPRSKTTTTIVVDIVEANVPTFSPTSSLLSFSFFEMWFFVNIFSLVPFCHYHATRH